MSLAFARHELAVLDITVTSTGATPYPLDDATLTLRITDRFTSRLLATRTPEIVNASAGTARVTLTSADVTGLPAGLYRYELWLDDPEAPRSEPIASGELTLTASAEGLT